MLICFLPLQIVAQNEADVTVKKDEISNYIQYADTAIAIKLNVNNEEEWFVLKGDDFEYDIRPNFSLGTSIGGSYKFLSGSYTFIPKFIPGNNDDELKGKSKARLFKFNLFFKKWGQQLALGQTKGYFLSNTSDFIPSWQDGDPYIQFPDLEVQFIRGNTFYKFNPDFSLKAISTQAEVQIKSAGTFIPALDYVYYNIDNKSNDTNQTSSQRSQNLEAVLELGYFYTFVVNRKWYAAVGLIPGIGYGTTKLTTRYPDENVITHYDNAVYRIKEAAGIGYNSLRFFSGCEFRLSQTIKNDNIPTVKLFSSRVNFQVFVGYRFAAPKFVKKTINYLEEKNPF